MRPGQPSKSRWCLIVQGRLIHRAFIDIAAQQKSGLAPGATPQNWKAGAEPSSNLTSPCTRSTVHWSGSLYRSQSSQRSHSTALCSAVSPILRSKPCGVHPSCESACLQGVLEPPSCPQMTKHPLWILGGLEPKSTGHHGDLAGSCNQQTESMLW